MVRRKRAPAAAPVADWVAGQLRSYPLAAAMLGRRSRRFGPGMRIPSGPLAYRSRVPPAPLTEDEEAALVFAAAGFTGDALADLSYGPGEGGSMLAGTPGRVVASADALDTVALFVINDDGTWFIRRPDNVDPNGRAEIVALVEAGRFTEAYRRVRIQVSPRRASIPVEPGLNFNINRWSMDAPGSTYFLPVTDLTAIYVNALLEAFEPEMGLFVLDERHLFLPAGLGRFGCGRGGHLDDDPRHGRVLTIQGLEMSFAEATAVEMGGMLHGLGLMTQALGLGGTCNYARNEYRWLEALGFDLLSMPSTRYVGANRLLQAIVRLRGQEFDHPIATGLRVEGEALLAAWCPPNHADMDAAVRAFVDHKFGPDGAWRSAAGSGRWADPASILDAARPPSPPAVDATIAYCSYIQERYGRFPAYAAPYRTIIGYQATQVDGDFYDRFYAPGALTVTQRTRHRLAQLGKPDAEVPSAGP